MEFIDLAKERYSLRKFSNKPMEKEKLDLVLQAGQVAPTACNYQPQRILVIDTAEALDKIKKCTPYHFNAPMVLLVCYDKNVSWKRKYDGKDSGVVDASIVTTQMILQATELGLGTTWVESYDPAVLIKEFDLPDHLVPAALLPIGYPAHDATKSPMHSQRKPIEETVFYNKF